MTHIFQKEGSQSVLFNSKSLMAQPIREIPLQSPVPSKPSAPRLQRDQEQCQRHARTETPGGRQAAPGPPRLCLHRAGVASILTGNCFLIADAFVKAAPELLAAISGDVVVTYVVQRNVAHCQAQTHTAVITENTAARCQFYRTRGLEGTLLGLCCGFCYVFNYASYNLTLKLRTGMN